MRLLVTRPEPDATALKARLIAQGHEVLVEPLLNVSLDDADPIELEWRAGAHRNQQERRARTRAQRRGRCRSRAAAVRRWPRHRGRGEGARVRSGHHWAAQCL